MTRSDRNIQRVFDALMKRPWDDFGTRLAKKLGMSYDEFQRVLKVVRSRAFIEEHGWTIPFVGQGAGKKNAYAVVDTRKDAEEYLHPGTRVRGSDILSALRNWDTQCDHGQILLDGRSAEGRWNRLASTQVKAMVQMAEAMGL